MRKIFISHSSKDAKIARYFIDDILVGSINIMIKEIFCSSTEGTRIESGDDWRIAIRKNLTEATIVILIITTNYKSSEICMNEMGAAWALCDNVIPLIVEPINYEDAGVLMEVKQLEKLGDEKSLDRVKDKLQAILKISPDQIKSDRWTVMKKEFLIKLGEYLKENPFPYPISEMEVNKFGKYNEELTTALKEKIRENEKLTSVIGKLKKLKDIKQVEAIKIKHGLTKKFDKFKELVKQVMFCLSDFHTSVIAIIYQDYSGRSLTIDIEYYGSHIEKAIARDFIDEDYAVKWRHTKEMNGLGKALSDLSHFIDSDGADPEFYEEFGQHYRAPLDIDNLLFWEEVFECKISPVLK